jgi:mRNA interferase RelE/StbE
MASYSIRWLPSAERDLRHIDRHTIPRIINAIRSLSDTPLSPHHHKLKDTENQYRLRVGTYRVLYEVDIEAQQVTILHVRHRGAAYR